MLENYKDILSPSDLASILGASKKSIYKLLSSGEIASRKIGRRYFICKDNLIQYLKK